MSSNLPSNQTLIIDEAGLMSSRQMLSLLTKAEQTHSRLILVGDTKQLSSIEAGGPFGLLQRSGIPTAYMDQSRRQQDPDLKIITDLAAQGHNPLLSSLIVAPCNQPLKVVGELVQFLGQHILNTCLGVS